MDDIENLEILLDLEEEYSSYGRSNRYAKAHAPDRKHKPRAPRLDELTDFIDDASAWVPTYAAPLDPKHHEREWLIESVAPFYRDNLITDVIRRAKGGKEANVYCCVAHPATEVPLIAAKLYRPRMLRTLKNDAIYKSGRQLRDQDGKQLKGRRERLALQQKTRFGRQLDMVWWIGNEFAVQKKLYDAGAAVPRPIGHIGNTILMDFIGDETLPAPTLNDVSLDPDEAVYLFDSVIHNVRIMLENHYVHGDLSAYNILYWGGMLTIIDFPQVVEARTNPNAHLLLQRDIRRVCDYFSRYKVASDPIRIVRDMWESYMGSG